MQRKHKDDTEGHLTLSLYCVYVRERDREKERVRMVHTYVQTEPEQKLHTV